MDALAAQVDALTLDARRGASVGAIGDVPGHPGSIVSKPVEGVLAASTPAKSALYVYIDGPGFFVVQRGRQIDYTRLGDFRFDEHGILVDGKGGRVLGWPAAGEDDVAKLAPIARRDAKGASVDSAGVVSIEGVHGRETIGRIALALFSAPEHLARIGDTSLRATIEAGAPRFERPGAPNVGSLKSHALEISFVDVAGDLEALWRVQRRGDVQAAQASADDACERTALGLVR